MQVLNQDFQSLLQRIISQKILVISEFQSAKKVICLCHQQFSNIFFYMLETFQSAFSDSDIILPLCVFGCSLNLC